MFPNIMSNFKANMVKKSKVNNASEYCMAIEAGEAIKNQPDDSKGKNLKNSHKEKKIPQKKILTNSNARLGSTFSQMLIAVPRPF